MLSALLDSYSSVVKWHTDQVVITSVHLNLPYFQVYQCRQVTNEKRIPISQVFSSFLTPSCFYKDIIPFLISTVWLILYQASSSTYMDRVLRGLSRFHRSSSLGMFAESFVIHSNFKLFLFFNLSFFTIIYFSVRTIMLLS